jgi:mannosyltransferase OCH1-like enzyme
LQVVLRLGGVYADLDTECRKPLSDLIQPRDTLVAGWENEFAVPVDAEKRHYVRSRQVGQLASFG